MIKESEKVLEKSLCDKVHRRNGWAIKLICTFISGLPDRLVLLPGGIVFFVEVKSTGKKPTKIQLLVHDRLRKLGFKVYVVDSSESLKKILGNYWIL